jgi:hypothetical protein
MLSGDVEAEDTEPAPGDPEAKPAGQLASDAKARDDFNRSRMPRAHALIIVASSPAGAQQVIQPPVQLVLRRCFPMQQKLRCFDDARHEALA